MIRAVRKDEERTELMISGKSNDIINEFSAVARGFRKALTDSGLTKEEANRFILEIIADAVKEEKEEDGD